MRVAVLIFLGLFGFCSVAMDFTQEQIDCFRRVNPYTELTDAEQRTVLGKASRFHHGYTGKWGQFMEFSQGIVIANTIQVVARFYAEPHPLEIVVVYNYETQKVTGFIAPDSKNKGIQAFELK